MATIGGKDFPWINDDEIVSLMGNPRPKTLAEIEEDPFWGDIFERWVYHQNDMELTPIYKIWKDDPKGYAREALKAHDGDLRKKFYDDLGEVKDAEHAREAAAGEAES